jgi:hypothetical protein
MLCGERKWRLLLAGLGASRANSQIHQLSRRALGVRSRTDPNPVLNVSIDAHIPYPLRLHSALTKKDTDDRLGRGHLERIMTAVYVEQNGGVDAFAMAIAR